MARSKLHDLLEMAREPSSERRRELLRGVTDLFFSSEDLRGEEMELFDDVLSQLAGEMEEAVRLELSQRMAQTPAPPRGLLRDLARELTGADGRADLRVYHYSGYERHQLERLAGDPEFAALGVSLDELRAAAEPRRFVGRAPEQVDEFLAEVVEPLLAAAGDRSRVVDEVRV